VSTLVIKLGIIGYRNHVERLVEVLQKRKDCKIEYFYHPTKKIKNSKITNNFKDLFLCDAIIISSPNSTHCEYIKKLEKNYSGYIFCEKPPATNLFELKKLKNLNLKFKSKIFFNFNYRFSNFNKIINKNLNSKKLGKIINVNIISSHGLAFKKGYASTWRADGKNNLNNILETVSIHFLDLAILNFGSIVKSHNISNLISKKGTSHDTSYLLLNHKNGVLTSILNSYATPLIEELMIVGTNGYLTIRNNKLKIYSPRSTFDKKGFFVSPPISSTTNFDMKSDYNNSLKKSIHFFISHVKNKKNFLANNYKLSLETNEILLKLEKNR
jgi:predicted dehydrogenase